MYRHIMFTSCAQRDSLSRRGVCKHISWVRWPIVVVLHPCICPILSYYLCYNVNKRVHPNNNNAYILCIKYYIMCRIYLIFIYIFFFRMCAQAAAGLDLKENLAAGATWPYHSVYHPYDAAFGYPFNGWVPPKIYTRTHLFIYRAKDIYILYYFTYIQHTCDLVCVCV